MLIWWKTVALAALCGAGTLAAQPAVPAQPEPVADTAPSLKTEERTGRVIVPEHLTAVDAPIVSAVRPLRPERQELSPEVALRVDRFKRDARAYLERQEALRKQIQGANEEERIRIREQLENLRRQWLERSRQMREEFQDRRAELMQRLPDHREMLENARDTAREQLKDSRGQVRKRRGDE